MPRIERSFPEKKAIEVVLHILDGADVYKIAHRYGVSPVAITRLFQGKSRPHIRDYAVKLYDDYRKKQRDDLQRRDKHVNDPSRTSV